MTFETAFKRIKAKFEEVDASKLADMAVQVTFTDEDCGGTFYFKATNGELAVEAYDYRDNDAVIDIERKALYDILSGKLTLDKAIEKGVATAKGDFTKLDTLNDAITKYVAPPRKKPVKEEVKEETKTEAKAEEKPAVKAVVSEPVKKVTKTEPVKKSVVKKVATTVKGKKR